MTYRERRMRRVERLRDWAPAHDRKSEAGFNAARVIADGIPMGQPILVGHHSEKRHRRDIERIDNGMRKGIEEARIADRMRSRADAIEEQAEGAIYSDDPDAVERLEERLAELEAERTRIKAFNAACRKAKTFVRGILTEAEERRLLRTFELCPYHKPEKGAPSYHLANLSGNIKRQRDRLVAVKARQAAQARVEAAGGVLIEQHGDHVVIRFAEYPGREVVEELRAAGFHYSGGANYGPAAKVPGIVRELAVEAAERAFGKPPRNPALDEEHESCAAAEER
jgi:hypothetical protein